ncbi:MAG TPA: hypothetical protein VG474_03090 [Solirubrobacteraceae bacterium]|nr:hypothetical protein [Solirubrobacteraceae bacterium]
MPGTALSFLSVAVASGGAAVSGALLVRSDAQPMPGPAMRP